MAMYLVKQQRYHYAFLRYQRTLKCGIEVEDGASLRMKSLIIIFIII